MFKDIYNMTAELINKFNTYLLEYYESNNSIDLKTFLYKNCIDGVNVYLISLYILYRVSLIFFKR